MGIRIDIDWNFISPVLQRASGILTIRHLVTIGENAIDDILLQCECHIERGSLGFRSIDKKGIPSKIFKVFDEQIHCMIYSFFKGMLLEKWDFHWIEETLEQNFNIDEWLSEKQEKIKGKI